jgi:hypothetical protein
MIHQFYTKPFLSFVLCWERVFCYCDRFVLYVNLLRVNNCLLPYKLNHVIFCLSSLSHVDNIIGMQACYLHKDTLLFSVYNVNG